MDLYLSAKGEYSSLNYVLHNHSLDSGKNDRNGKGMDEKLSDINKDYLMWLQIPGTAINYPVVRAYQSGYYLNHTFFGTENPGGCIFVLEDAPLPDRGNMVIFGHNMKDGTMFSDLKKYRREEFYKDHNRFQICLKDKWYDTVIYSIQIRDEDDLDCYETEFMTPWERETFIVQMKNSSLFETEYRPSKEDGLITLSTCYGSRERMIVQAAVICYTENRQ